MMSYTRTHKETLGSLYKYIASAYFSFYLNFIFFYYQQKIIIPPKISCFRRLSFFYLYLVSFLRGGVRGHSHARETTTHGNRGSIIYGVLRPRAIVRFGRRRRRRRRDDVVLSLARRRKQPPSHRSRVVGEVFSSDDDPSWRAQLYVYIYISAGESIRGALSAHCGTASSCCDVPRFFLLLLLYILPPATCGPHRIKRSINTSRPLPPSLSLTFHFRCCIYTRAPSVNKTTHTYHCVNHPPLRVSTLFFTLHQGGVTMKSICAALVITYHFLFSVCLFKN